MSKESELMAAVEAIIDGEADTMERREELRSNIVGAMAYLEDLHGRVRNNELTGDDRRVLIALIQRESDRYWGQLERTDNR